MNTFQGGLGSRESVEIRRPKCSRGFVGCSGVKSHNHQTHFSRDENLESLGRTSNQDIDILCQLT
jgi:hypothetical protein